MDDSRRAAAPADPRRTTAGPVRVVLPSSAVAELVVRPAVAIAGERPLGEAIEAMRAADVSSLLVHGPPGVLTERDVVRAVGAGCTVDAPVASAATPHPVRVDGGATVSAAAALMLNEDVRHLVVDLPGGATGIVSIRDVLAVLLAAAQPQLWLTSLRIAISPTSR
jgi:CBS domain-containing protein